MNRQKLRKAIIRFGNPQKYVNVVKMCNHKTLLKVLFLQRLSPAFEVNLALPQVNTLYLTLFNLGLEKVIREYYKDRRMEVIGKETVLS